MKKHKFNPETGLGFKYFCEDCGTYFNEPDGTGMREDEPSHACCPACYNEDFDDCIDLIGENDAE